VVFLGWVKHPYVPTVIPGQTEGLKGGCGGMGGWVGGGMADSWRIHGRFMAQGGKRSAASGDDEVVFYMEPQGRNTVSF
jgi:hypothetical protein